MLTLLNIINVATIEHINTGIHYVPFFKKYMYENLLVWAGLGS